MKDTIAVSHTPLHVFLILRPLSQPYSQTQYPQFLFALLISLPAFLYQVLSGHVLRDACWLVSSQTTPLAWVTCCLQEWRTWYETGGNCNWRYQLQASCLSSTYGEKFKLKHKLHCVFILYMNVLFVALISSSALISPRSLACVHLPLPSPPLCAVRVLPQSARWLLANDRREEAIALLKKAALINGRVLPPSVQVWVFNNQSLIVHSYYCQQISWN